MPNTSLLGLTRLAKPLTSEEGRRILERDQYRCQYCGLDGMSSFENSLIMTVDLCSRGRIRGKKCRRTSLQHVGRAMSLRVSEPFTVCRRPRPTC